MVFCRPGTLFAHSPHCQAPPTAVRSSGVRVGPAGRGRFGPSIPGPWREEHVMRSRLVLGAIATFLILLLVPTAASAAVFGHPFRHPGG